MTSLLGGIERRAMHSNDQCPFQLENQDGFM